MVGDLPPHNKNIGQHWVGQGHSVGVGAAQAVGPADGVGGRQRVRQEDDGQGDGHGMVEAGGGNEFLSTVMGRYNQSMEVIKGEVMTVDLLEVGL